jgi:hypothetical protein
MRIRTVKPEFWAHPVMSRLPYDTRILGLGLLNLADDEGYFDADPDYIRGAVLFREDSSNVRRMLDELSRSEWITLCGRPERPIGRVVNFRKHQRVDRPQPSRLKQYALDESSTNYRRALDDQSTPDQGSGKGKDTPIVPASGDDAPPATAVEDPLLLRAKAIFRMRPGTPLDRSQARAWRTALAAVDGTTEPEWQLLEAYYCAVIASRDDYRRRDLATLLNNWSGELTRAAAWAERVGWHSENSEKKEKGPAETEWREALQVVCEQGPELLGDIDVRSVRSWSQLPADVQAAILKIITDAESEDT